MPRFKMIAHTKPMPGREAEFNEWYQNTHLPDICSIPGVVGAQRYVEAAAMMGADDRKYLAIYDIETDDIDAVHNAIIQATISGKFTPSSANDVANSYLVSFVEFGERVVG